MNAAHPITRSNRPINLILISTSGGTQVALGTTAHLNEWINARLTVVSLGGRFDGRAEFNHANHVYHLHAGAGLWVLRLIKLEDRGATLFAILVPPNTLEPKDILGRRYLR